MLPVQAGTVLLIDRTWLCLVDPQSSGGRCQIIMCQVPSAVIGIWQCMEQCKFCYPICCDLAKAGMHVPKFGTPLSQLSTQHIVSTKKSMQEFESFFTCVRPRESPQGIVVCHSCPQYLICEFVQAIGRSRNEFLDLLVLSLILLSHWGLPPFTHLLALRL